MARTDCTIDAKQVPCPKASTSGYGKHNAQVGDWVTWRWDGVAHLGRMIGRIVYAPGSSACPEVRNWLLVAALTTGATSCCERWVAPADVERIHGNAPDIGRFLAWFASADLAQLAKRDVQALRGVMNYGAARANLAADRPDWDGDKRRAVYFEERAKRIEEHGYAAAANFGLQS